MLNDEEKEGERNEYDVRTAKYTNLAVKFIKQRWLWCKSIVLFNDMLNLLKCSFNLQLKNWAMKIQERLTK